MWKERLRAPWKTHVGVRVGIGIALSIGANACTPVDDPPPQPNPDFCVAEPCDPLCETADSPACEPHDPDPPPCDALCDPCQDTCRACTGTCDVPFVGPSVADVDCHAEPIETDSDNVHRWAISFDVDAQTPAWLLTSYAADLHSLVGVSLEMPQGQTLNLDTWGRFNLHQQDANPAALHLLMPSAPDDHAWLQSGTYTLTVDTEGDTSPCSLLVEQLPYQEDLPRRLYVRIVGVAPSLGDVDALQRYELLRDALADTQRYFMEAGIALYVREWMVPDSYFREQYQEIASTEQGLDMLRDIPRSPSTSALDALTIDVAFVERFSYESMLNGLTGGLPGPVMLHGAVPSGVILSAGLLTRYRGDEQIGIALAHELGHYLGLRHTSASLPFGYDRLPDTPECPVSTLNTRAGSCEDASNFMFPVLSMKEAHTWSATQIAVMRGHPSVTQRTE